MRTNPTTIKGDWDFGVVLDLYTVSSMHVGTKPDGTPQFDNVYTPIGKLVHDLKYLGDQTAAPAIIAAATAFLKPHAGKLDLIVPVPASTPRPVQPVTVLASGIGAALGLPVAACVTCTRPATALKGVADPQARKHLLRGLHAVDAARTRGKSVLLVDDVYRSGATLSAITALLRQQGGATFVRVIAMAQTRTRQ